MQCKYIPFNSLLSGEIKTHLQIQIFIGLFFCNFVFSPQLYFIIYTGIT